MLTYALGSLAVASLIGYFIISWRPKKKYRLPPGPPGLPFIGNGLQLEEKAPHNTFTEWQKEYGDVYTIKLFGSQFIVLNSYETIYESLVTKSNDFAGRSPFYRMDLLRNFCRDIAFTSYNKKWVFMKKLTTNSLKMYGNHLQRLEEISLQLIEDMNGEYAEMVAKAEPFDLQPILHRCVTGIITSILYGTKVKDSDVKGLLETTRDSQHLIGNSGGRVALDIWPWLRFGPLRNLYHDLIEVRARNEHWFLREAAAAKERYIPGNPQCLLDGLLEYQRKSSEQKMEFELTDDDIYGIMTNIIFAGTVTTSTTLYALIAILVNFPELQEKMAAEILNTIGERTPKLEDRAILPYTEAAILEVLRYTTILPMNIPHCTITDTQIGGYDVPKNTNVFYNLWKLHHDEEFWKDPWVFRPERYLDEEGKVVPPDHPNRARMFAFGAGRRSCLGETLARNRLFLMIVSLLQKFIFQPEAKDKLPKYDPRDYKNGFGIIPQSFQCHLALRGDVEEKVTSA